MPPSADDFDDDEFVPLTAEELQRELDRMTAGMPKVEDPLPEDLAELRTEIRGPVLLRRTLFPDLPFAQFEGFEARDVMIGGMGLVIEAYDRTLERKVAIKLWIQSGPKAQAALLAEARTLAKLSHPNVVTIHGTGRWGDRVYFIMEWIEGVDGHAWLEQPRPWQEVLEVFVLAGMGLAAAHDEGIQHRDFKPSNMLLGDDGRVLVADFGVAASLLEVATEDERGKLVGTPRYMAPERLRGELGDARSDQFSSTR